MTISDKLGKCCYSKAGERYGYQRYRENLSDNRVCDVCFHDTGFHEKEKENEETVAPVAPAISSSILNQVLTGQALEEESITNELSQTFSQQNSSTRSRRGAFRNFDPVFAITNYNLTQSNRNRNRREVSAREPRETLVQIILLSDVGYSL